jgi:hypothetical protein
VPQFAEGEERVGAAAFADRFGTKLDFAVKHDTDVAEYKSDADATRANDAVDNFMVDVVVAILQMITMIQRIRTNE